MESLFKHLSDITEQELNLFTSITPMKLRDKESIAIRPTPSSNESYRLDGGYTYNFSFQLLVKHQNWLTAWETISAINHYWNGATRKDLDIPELTLLETATNPNWVEKNSHNYHIFTALYRAELETRRN
mgnify:CR=1 FL=1